MNRLIYNIRKNKVVALIALLTLSIIYIIYSNFQSSKLTSSILENKKTVPNVLVTKGNAIIKRDTIIKLKEKERADLKVGDKIKTFENSNATIFWPDGSITRLGAKSGIEIKEMRANQDLSVIKIKFNLDEGRSWSNIVKFMNNDSFFTETYEDGNYAATVRGTVFEVNLEEGYVHALDHDVLLTDIENGKSSTVPEGGAKNLFNIMSNVPSDVWDQDWIKENLDKDSRYLNELAQEWKNKLIESVKSQNVGTKAANYIKGKFGNSENYVISSLSDSLLNSDTAGIEKLKEILPEVNPTDKALLNKKLLKFYQNIHGLPNDEDMALYKSELRDMILNTTDDKGKKSLLENFTRLNIYDYIDVTKDKTSKISGKLYKNIEGYLNQMTDPEELRNLLESFGTDMLNVIGVEWNQISKETNEIIMKLNDANFQKSLKTKILRDSKKLNDSIDNILEK